MSGDGDDGSYFMVGFIVCVVAFIGWLFWLDIKAAGERRENPDPCVLVLRDQPSLQATQLGTVVQPGQPAKCVVTYTKQ